MDFEQSGVFPGIFGPFATGKVDVAAGGGPCLSQLADRGAINSR